MPIATSRTARLAAIIGVPVALVASGLVVSTASYSAFSATTSNPASNWTTGTVVLADDDADAALFTATGLKPGSTGSNCITVTSTGSLPSTVQLYGTGAATTKDLAANIALTVEQGSGGGFGSCAGFTPAATGGSLFSGTLAGFGTAHSSFATGIGGWAPTGTASESRVYRFSYTVSANTPNTAQGGTATLGFTWQAQNS